MHFVGFYFIKIGSCFVHFGLLFVIKFAAFRLLYMRLEKSNEMQQYADIYLLLNYSTCFGRPSRPSSGVHKTVVAPSGADHTSWRATSLLPRQYDLYQRLQLQFYVLLMMGAMDARNM